MFEHPKVEHHNVERKLVGFLVQRPIVGIDEQHELEQLRIE